MASTSTPPAMKYLVLIYFIIFAQGVIAQTYNLTLSITNIRNLTGEIRIGVYNNKYSFPKKKEEYKTFSFPVKAGSEVFTIRNLPKGEYAIAIFHDKNSDGKCNTDFWGIPEEGYGFSKNYRPVLFAPSFNDCKIELTANTQMTVKLIF